MPRQTGPKPGSGQPGKRRKRHRNLQNRPLLQAGLAMLVVVVIAVWRLIGE
tara:strand:+ start:62 stop:214 length:153 start_codon:yes stop_codon:yes gene_type:complete